MERSRRDVASATTILEKIGSVGNPSQGGGRNIWCFIQYQYVLQSVKCRTDDLRTSVRFSRTLLLATSVVYRARHITRFPEGDVVGLKSPVLSCRKLKRGSIVIRRPCYHCYRHPTMNVQRVSIAKNDQGTENENA